MFNFKIKSYENKNAGSKRVIAVLQFNGSAEGKTFHDLQKITQAK